MSELLPGAAQYAPMELFCENPQALHGVGQQQEEIHHRILSLCLPHQVEEEPADKHQDGRQLDEGELFPAQHQGAQGKEIHQALDNVKDFHIDPAQQSALSQQGAHRPGKILMGLPGLLNPQALEGRLIPDAGGLFGEELHRISRLLHKNTHALLD